MILALLWAAFGVAPSQQTIQNSGQSSSQLSASRIQVNTLADFTVRGQYLAQLNEASPFQAESVDAEIVLQPEEEGLFDSIDSSTSVLVILALTIFLFIYRKTRSSRAPLNTEQALAENEMDEDGWLEVVDEPLPFPAPNQPVLAKPAAPVQGIGSAKARRPGNLLTVATPDSLYGAYRIDQEVCKLVLGQPHRMDVLSSRAPDDRRAIETSLVKMIAATADETERRRACDALEEYGFVARQCAALLLATEPFDRTSAARSLGAVKSPAALPFLLEALYDHESIVRNQAVVSIGELKLPKAIGALLDMARQHPDVPASLVSRALSACSVEGLDFFDAIQPSLLTAGRLNGVTHEISRLEPSSSFEDLPESSDDEALVETLSQVQSTNLAKRLNAAKDLAQYEVRRAVAALSALARLDREPGIRSQAISSLAAINHESVFPAVLIGMADESREVRAAAARSLSHLSFDRADAYVRLIETSDQEMLQDVARACIEAGIVAQGIDRLASGDRRQAYEAFSIVSLLARAHLTETILEAVCNHSNLDVRLAVVRLLANLTQPEIIEQLRELTVKDGIEEEVRTALLEALYKLDQGTLKVVEPKAIPELEKSQFAADGEPKPGNDGKAEFCRKVEAHADELE